MATTKSKIPKTLTLDVSKWRCGSGSEVEKNRIGHGWTEMLNHEKYMCCLGQFSLQLGCVEGEIYERSHPVDVSYSIHRAIPLLSRKSDDKCGYQMTKLSQECLYINDNEKTTVRDKVEGIRKVLRQRGIKLIVKNKHLIP